MCDQQSLRSTCAYAQSDQSLCLSLEYFMTVKLLTEHQLEFLSLKGGCAGSSESTLVKLSNCWKSHAAAQLWKMDLKKGQHTRSHMRKCLLKTDHADVSSEARGLNVGLGLHIHPYFVYASGKGSDESAA